MPICGSVRNSVLTVNPVFHDFLSENTYSLVVMRCPLYVHTSAKLWLMMIDALCQNCVGKLGFGGNLYILGERTWRGREGVSHQPAAVNGRCVESQSMVLLTYSNRRYRYGGFSK